VGAIAKVGHVDHVPPDAQGQAEDTQGVVSNFAHDLIRILPFAVGNVEMHFAAQPCKPKSATVKY